MNARLVGVDPWSRNREIPLAQLPVLIGRSPEAAVRLDDRWASRRHCEISELEGKLVVRDLESRHGTFVNGRLISQALLLPGDRLTVGATVFEAQYDHDHSEKLTLSQVRQEKAQNLELAFAS